MERDSFVAALLNFAKGEQRDVDIVIRQLQLPSCKDQYMADAFNRVKNCVALLERDSYELVVLSLLTVDWTNRSVAVIKAYHTFIVNLVSAHSVYTPAVLKSLISLFMSGNKRETVSSGILFGQLDIEQRRRFEEEMKHVHSTLMSVVKAVPSCVRTLPKVILTNFPYPLSKDSQVVEMYIQNVLHMTVYCPAIRSEVLAAVVEKMLYIDVRASRERIEELDESDSEDEDDPEIFHMESDMVAKETKADENKLIEADRLDTIMCIAFNYIDRTCKNHDGSLNWEASKKLYLELLGLFEKIILPTHECCHTQYLLFYICSFKQNLADGFMDYLWKKVKNPNEYQIHRKSAICYLASFIVRAKFVSIRSAADAVSLLCEWIHQYIRAAHQNSMQYDISHHGTFYSVVQAVLYILAFRQKEFLEMDKADSFFMGLSLQMIVTCKLNPLRVCQPVVTRTFSSFVRKHQLAFCDVIIERNNRLMVPASDSSGGCGFANQHLESYFPFDPYLLLRSAVKVVDMYRVFEGNAIVDIVPAKGHEDEDDDFMEEENKMSVGGSHYAKSPTDLFLGSISPGFNTVSHHLPR